MITVKLAAESDSILTFAGDVIEVFYGERSQRVHIGHVQSIELQTDRKGRHELVIQTVAGPIPYLPVDETQQAHAQAVIAAVQEAMAAFRLP
jgi:hypothetical protein